jgi:hypothetical protein
MSKQRLRLLPSIVHAGAGIAFRQTASDDASEAARAMSLFPAAWKRLEEAYSAQLGGRALTVDDRFHLLDYLIVVGGDVGGTELAKQPLGEEEGEDSSEQVKTFEQIRDALRWSKRSGAVCRSLALLDQRTLALLLARATSNIKEGDDPCAGF